MSGSRHLTVTIRPKRIFRFLLMVMFIILCGANTQNPDIFNYSYGYYRYADVMMEGAFLGYLIRKVFVSYGVSYEYYRLFLYALGYLALFGGIRKLVKDNYSAYLFYAISFMMMDSTQTNNFLGFCFLYLGIAYLISEDSRLKYLICVVIACGFHAIFIFYAPFIFIYRKTDHKQMLKLYLIVLLIIIAFATIMQSMGLASVMNRVLSYVNLNTYSVYMNSRTRFGHLYPMMTQLICCGFGMFFYYRSQVLNLETKNEIRIIMLLLLYGIFAFPLFRFQLTLGRLSRNLQLLTFVSGALYAKELKSAVARRNVYICLLILALFLGYMILVRNYADTIVAPFFSNNWILGGK